MIQKLASGRWQARHRPVPGGKQIARNFDRKLDAQRWLDEQKAAIITGQYVDPRAGKTTFRDYAEQWRQAQAHRPSSAAHVETMLRRHAYPTFGHRALSTILPSEVQAWTKGLDLAPATVAVAHSIVSSVMKAAVRDRKILANPCEGTKLPEVDRARVVVPSLEQVEQLTAAMPEHLRALVTLAAGTGMRQGEVLGLTVDRLHMLRREVVVDQQLVKLTGSAPVLGPPKTKASRRTIPLPDVVLEALAAHLAAYDDPERSPRLVFTTMLGEPLTRQRFGHLWRPVAATAGLERGTGMHVLRHFYASMLIEHGESVKVVQARLGHASATETLDTYAHLWPDSDDRTRQAVDKVLGRAADDSLMTQDTP